MGKYKNISGGDLDVPLADTVVGDGEVAELPDFQPAHNPVFTNPDGTTRPSVPGDPEYLAVEWPPNRWEPVTEPKAAKSKAGA